MRRALLLYTAGHTDVQLLEGEHRRELDKARAGRVHEALAQRTDWSLADAKPKRPGKRAAAGGPEAAAQPLLPEAAFQLCTPKLDAVLAYLDEQKLQLRHALILHTDRPGGNDPTQAGPILQRRLRERGHASLELTSYLGEKGETVEDEKSPGEEVLRRAVVRRLDEAITAALAHPSGPFDVVVVAALGGLPKVQTLVLELARLRAGPRECRELDAPDAPGEEAERAIQCTETTDPSSVIAATRHALQLVERGDFIAAWGAVSHLDERQQVSPVFRWLYEWATSMPHAPEQAPPPGFPLPRGDQRALAAALRVELALLRGDTAHAIQKTFAFFEAAIWDVLHRDYIRDAKEIKERVAFTMLPEPTPSQMKKFRDAFDLVPSEPRHTFVKNYGNGAFAICKHYIAELQPGSATATSLLALADKVSKIQRLRNMFAHSEPHRDRLGRAQDKLQQHRLWSEKQRPSITTQALFQDVLAALGAPPLAEFLEELLAATRRHALATWSAQ